MQLEEELRKSTNLEVYYSDIALAPDAISPQLPYSRIAVFWRRGVFHPKLVLLLVKQKGSKFKPLIVCCLSANLTRSGWWENVECCHIEEIHDYRTSQGKKGSSFRTDLIAVLRRIQKRCRSRKDAQIDVIFEFLEKRVKPAKNTNNVDTPIRMFGGHKSKSFAHWLEDTIPEQFRNKQLNLEVISPYFDSAGIDPLERIINVVNPVKTRVHLPKLGDGTIFVSENVYNNMLNHPKIEWAELPDKFISRTGADSNLLPRFVHAKVYRLWYRRRKCPNIFIIGFVNCTSAATGEYKNMEVAILVNKSDDSQQFQRKWLLAIDDEESSVRFLVDVPDEQDGLERPQGDISIRFDWQTNALEVVPSPKR